MAEPVRFPAQVPYEKWPSLYGVFTAMEAGDFALAEQRWNANKQNCLDSAGAIQYWYEQFGNVPTKDIGVWTPQGPTQPDPGYQLIPGDTVTRYQGYVDVPLPPYQQASPLFRVSLSDSSGNGSLQLQVADDPSKFTNKPGVGGGSATPVDPQDSNIKLYAGKRMYYAMNVAQDQGPVTFRLRVDVPTNP